MHNDSLAVRIFSINCKPVIDCCRSCWCFKSSKKWVVFAVSDAGIWLSARYSVFLIAWVNAEFIFRSSWGCIWRSGDEETVSANSSWGVTRRVWGAERIWFSLLLGIVTFPMFVTASAIADWTLVAIGFLAFWVDLCCLMFKLWGTLIAIRCFRN